MQFHKCIHELSRVAMINRFIPNIYKFLYRLMLGNFFDAILHIMRKGLNCITEMEPHINQKGDVHIGEAPSRECNLLVDVVDNLSEVRLFKYTIVIKSERLKRLTIKNKIL